MIAPKRKDMRFMRKTAVIFWSGTGNTKAMAQAVCVGAKNAGADAALFNASEFSVDLLDSFDGIAFGCPAMGAEELEESEFEPMFAFCEPRLKGKKIALFGSYGWGDGEWMRTWEERCEGLGADIVCESVICNGEPDDEALTACRELGKALA